MYINHKLVEEQLRLLSGANLIVNQAQPNGAAAPAVRSTSRRTGRATAEIIGSTGYPLYR